MQLMDKARSWPLSKPGKTRGATWECQSLIWRRTEQMEPTTA